MTDHIGRFAPSPSGPLHSGSLLAAVASYVDAKAHNGQWLLRIEDVDRHRTVEGSRDSILNSLEHHGLHWDGTIEHQSHNDERYEAALEQLQQQQQVFFCQCSRTALKQTPGPYPGTCRAKKTSHYIAATRHQPASHTLRFECGEGSIDFTDRILGQQSFQLAQLGDFILRRRDSLFAYQLAVVIDDAEQSVTSVVRGADLLSSTPWQIALQQALNLPAMNYAHLPLITHANNGQKLSKQTGAPAINNDLAAHNIYLALTQLGQQLPEQGQRLSVDQLLAWAIDHWQINEIPKTALIAD
ncbi:MAG: tRNA glutamyl-Q(34) synthetase GluQRS [Pseudomonadales bacterium]|nr:tRNA glutamyl-Q(34) synthetase GluQRS [Pseudomonadales bacterium]